MDKCVCEICGRDDAVEIEVGSEGLGISCKDCTDYVITLETQQKMLGANLKFDLEPARLWIRLHTKTDQIPIITWTVAENITVPEFS